MCCRSVPNSQIQSHSAAQEREQLEMSYDESMSIWVGDLDDFVHIYDDDDYYKEESRLQELENDLDELGEILLFSGKSTSARSLNKKGISPQEWRVEPPLVCRRLITSSHATISNVLNCA
jgi:hypothetical protein